LLGSLRRATTSLPTSSSQSPSPVHGELRFPDARHGAAEKLKRARGGEKSSLARTHELPLPSPPSSPEQPLAGSPPQIHPPCRPPPRGPASPPAGHPNGPPQAAQLGRHRPHRRGVVAVAAAPPPPPHGDPAALACAISAQASAVLAVMRRGLRHP
uniref:Uncharacterized protein n=1 Tax=Aegilops tauschii subsp. strangulata TaxID=200361 RepID=A0A453H1K0_AEGTS